MTPEEKHTQLLEQQQAMADDLVCEAKLLTVFNEVQRQIFLDKLAAMAKVNAQISVLDQFV